MKTGIIIANTGSPASANPDDVEAYLREFLLDDRIRQLPRAIWKFFMWRHILPRRKYTSAERYKFVWSREGSPLLVIQKRLAKKVQSELNDDAMIVRSAMSYGAPSITDMLVELKDAGCMHIILIPLYPQSAYSPTQAVIDAYKRAVKSTGCSLPTCIIDNYHDDPRYIRAIANQIRNTGFGTNSDDHLVLSWHAIPLKDERAGDTYRAQTRVSADLFARELGIERDRITVSYQSVFGPHKKYWVSPLSEDILPTWRDKDFQVYLACPGFAVDCLETAYDIPNILVPAFEGESHTPIRNACDGDIQAACNTDGRFHWVPSLNDSDAQVDLIVRLIERTCEHGVFKSVV